jgi:hypothetical protein
MKTLAITVNKFGRDHPVADLHLYCGRTPKMPLIPPMVDAGLGNPFWMGSEKDRDQVCEQYADMLDAQPLHPHWKRIRRIAEHLVAGRSVALYCYCAPKRCHCDTIRAHAIRIATEWTTDERFALEH